MKFISDRLGGATDLFCQAKNWDALFDCLLNLHSGGIWGTSPVIEFPLELIISGAETFARDNPEAFAVLNDVLEQTRETYARTGRVFEFVIRE